MGAATLALSGCGFDCGTRGSTTANATVRDTSRASLATVRVSLSDNVGPSFLRLSVGVMGFSSSGGGPLRGHVTRARLMTEAGQVLAEIPTSTETLPFDGVVALNADLSSRTEFDRVRSALLTGRATIVIDTDLPGREHLETMLTDAQDVPGSVQRCHPV